MVTKVNQMIPFGQVIPKWVEKISDRKRQRKREQVASYNKQKDQLKTGEALIHANATTTLSQMKFRVHILVSETSLFFLPVHITVKLNKAILRRSLSQ